MVGGFHGSVRYEIELGDGTAVVVTRIKRLYDYPKGLVSMQALPAVDFALTGLRF